MSRRVGNRFSAGRLFLFVALVVVLAPSSVLLSDDVPFLTGRVVDLAGMIPDDVEHRLEALLAAHEERTGNQVVVLTIWSLEGEALEAYSHRVAEAWKLGRGEQDDGVLFLVAKEERRMRIDTGYGLEATLTDLRARRIINDVVQPRFRAGDMGGGFEAGVSAILASLDGQELPAPTGPRAVPSGIPLDLILFIVILIIFIILSSRRRRGRAEWSSRDGWGDGPIILLPGSRSGRSSGRRGGGFGGGGFGGGGFGGFSGGGGSFGGGGASGGW